MDPLERWIPVLFDFFERTGLLFAVVGRMIYDRTHTRDLTVLPGLALNRVIPFAAFTFVLVSAAAMGIPGFSGFAAEITILIGTWRAYPALVIVAGVGMVLTADRVQ